MQTFDNHGYDHWDPMESRETYASMDRHFQSPDFQPQVPNSSLSLFYGPSLVNEFTCIILRNHKAMKNCDILGFRKDTKKLSNFRYKII